MAGKSLRLNESLNLGPGSLEGDSSLIQDGHPVAAFAGLFEAVGDQEDCLSQPLRQGAPEEAAKLGRRARVQALGGLVQQEDSRIGQEGTGQAELLLHPLRVGHKGGTGGPVHPYRSQDLCNAGGRLPRDKVVEGGKESQVLNASEAVVKAPLGVQAIAYRLSDSSRGFDDVVPVDGGPPLGGEEQSTENFQEGCFSSC